MRLLVFVVALIASAAGSAQDSEIIKYPEAMQLIYEKLQKCLLYDSVIHRLLVKGAPVSILEEYKTKTVQQLEDVETILALPDYEKPLKRMVHGDFLQNLLSTLEGDRELVNALKVFNRIRAWQLDPGAIADGIALARQLSFIQAKPLNSIYKDRLIKEMIRLYQKYRLFPLHKSCLLLHRLYSIPPCMLRDYELEEDVFEYLDATIRRIYLHYILPEGCEPTYNLDDIQGILSLGFGIDNVTLERMMSELDDIVATLHSNFGFDSRKGEWRDALLYPIRYMSYKEKRAIKWNDI